MKKRMLLLLSVAGLVFADPPPPKPQYYQDNISTFTPQAQNSYFVRGPYYLAAPIDVSCQCTAVTWEWTGKMWQKLVDLFAIDPSLYVTKFYIGVPTVCTVDNTVYRTIYQTTTVDVSNGVQTPGLGSELTVTDIWGKLHDKWKSYCDGTNIEYNLMNTPIPCG